MSKNYILKSSENFEIDITSYGNEKLTDSNCIIFIHGFKGFKDWGFVPYLGDYFSRNGFFVITFNFSHNGVGRNSVDFNELGKFAENSYSREISETNDIIQAYYNGFFGEVNSSNKIGLLGHSRGGGVTIVSASTNAAASSLVTWSSIAKFDRWTDRHKEEWREKGYFEVLNTRTNQLMRMNRSFIDDIEKNSHKLLDLKLGLKNLNIPHLIVHGDQDLAVPVSEAESLYLWSNKSQTELLKIAGTGHTFDIKHPFEGSTTAFDMVLDKTNHFFQKSLNR